jgi:ketosteroid isomerase-like protein
MRIREIRTGRQVDMCRARVARWLTACVTLVMVSVTIPPATAAPEDEVRAAFDGFIAAQNAHDIKAVESLLLSTPHFLWITRGTPVWGQDAALKRFVSLYQGAWHLEPEAAGLKIIMLGDGAAQVFVPILFTIGAPNQQPQQTKFLMNQMLVKTQGGWKVSSILPIPVPTQ